MLQCSSSSSLLLGRLGLSLGLVHLPDDLLVVVEELLVLLGTSRWLVSVRPGDGSWVLVGLGLIGSLLLLLSLLSVGEGVLDRSLVFGVESVVSIGWGLLESLSGLWVS